MQQCWPLKYGLTGLRNTTVIINANGTKVTKIRQPETAKRMQNSQSQHSKYSAVINILLVGRYQSIKKFNKHMKSFRKIGDSFS